MDTSTLGDLGSLAQGLGSIYGAYQGYNTASGLNNQLQGILGQNSNASNSTIAGLQGQAGNNQAMTLAQYQQAVQDAQTQNGQLQGNIDTMTSSLSGLSDPNSPYMQMARQAIERKDAAAGRNSQWGDREVQLAGTLADYVGKYSPSLQNSITAARNQINTNNQGVASIFGTMNNSTNNTNQTLQQLLSGQLSGASSLNNIGRASANSQTNNLTSLLNSGIKGIGSLSNLFGLSSGESSMLPTMPTLYSGSNLSDYSGSSGDSAGGNYGGYGGGGYSSGSGGSSIGDFISSLWS